MLCEMLPALIFDANQKLSPGVRNRDRLYTNQLTQKLVYHS